MRTRAVTQPIEKPTITAVATREKLGVPSDSLKTERQKAWGMKGTSASAAPEQGEEPCVAVDTAVRTKQQQEKKDPLENISIP